MVEPIASFIIENDKEFARVLDRLAKVSRDFRVPFAAISRAWYQSNKQIFTLKGPGLYKDFKTEKSRQQKLRATRKLTGSSFDYPLLFRSGRLANSMLNPQAPGAHNFIGRQTLEMGTLIDYAIYHQLGTRAMAQRQMIFISGGPKEEARDARAGGRLKRWVSIVEAHIKDTLEKETKG